MFGHLSNILDNIIATGLSVAVEICIIIVLTKFGKDLNSKYIILIATIFILVPMTTIVYLYPEPKKVSGDSGGTGGDSIPPTSETPSRFDILSLALKSWKESGFRAGDQTLKTLQHVDESSDAPLFSEDAAAWAEIRAAKDAINASAIGLSADTRARLPFYLDVEIDPNNDLEINKVLLSRLISAGFLSANKDHAAFVITLDKDGPMEEIKDGDMPDKYRFADKASAGRKLSVRTTAVFSDGSGKIIYEKAPIESRTATDTNSPIKELCIETDAALASIDGFIERFSGIKSQYHRLPGGCYRISGR